MQKLFESFGPVIIENQIVPLRDDVSEGTAVATLAERHTAVHTAGGLNSQAFTDVIKVIDFVPIFHTFFSCSVNTGFSGVLDKSSEKKSYF